MSSSELNLEAGQLRSNGAIPSLDSIHTSIFASNQKSGSHELKLEHSPSIGDRRITNKNGPAH
jgi:hypothetical protein